MIASKRPAGSASLPALAAAAAIIPISLAVWAAPGSYAPQPKISYNRDIRPILAENCFPCHGPDSAARKADLRLDRLQEATADRGGHAAIVKGNPAKSELILRVTGQHSLMPPPVTKRTLTQQQIAALREWIAQGAEYEMHWSLIPPKRPALPPVKDMAWCRNAIDRFILAKLDENGLRPAPEADRRTLARRLSLDLTGLPPEPADVERFVADKSPNAYEKLVDKYLASPQYGEHRARYWLDAARYADSNGIHFDNYREMWAYRDWVIKAYNANMPFSEFTIENLAGDLIPNATTDQKIGSGFNRCNITTNEGGAIDEEYRVLYARDRTEATAWTWLGSTMNCCVCHDHKFDPFTQRDFYSMSAFFNNTTQAAMDGNIKNTPPVMFVPLEQDRSRFDALEGEMAAARKAADDRKLAARPDFDKWLSGATPSTVAAAIPSEELRLHAPLTEGQGRTINVSVDGKSEQIAATADPGWEDGHVGAKAFQRKMGSAVVIPQAGDFEKDQSWTVAAWVKLGNPNQGGAIAAREDNEHDYRGWDFWLEGGKVGSHIISKWPENALKVVSKDPIPADGWHHVCLTYSGGAKPESVRVYVDGSERATDVAMNTLHDTIRTAVPFKIGQRHSSEGADGTGIQDLRLYGRALKANEVQRLAQGTRAAYLVSRGATQLSAAEKEELFGWWLVGADESYRTLSSKIAALTDEDRGIRMRGTEAHVMHDRDEPAVAYILNRGEYDQHRDKVSPATPAVLPPMPAEYPRNRLGFAKWLLLPQHPLTTRVTVNRFWQELFGAGIVRTPNDFGVTGELPTHPELLDWLAVEFREGGWNIKKQFKLMVMSATYRQSALATPEKKAKDPLNKLISRGPRFRMDAEMIRDCALAASGMLVKKIGGPSVKPYQPDGVWEAVAMPESNTRYYKRDSGESLYRRSMYTFWKRAAPPASLDIFNAPNRETCTVRRERTDTPLQALVTLNDTQYVEAARVLAGRALKEGSTTDAHIDFLAERLLARPLKPEELAIVRKSATDLVSFYNAHADDASKLITQGESKPDATIPPAKLAAWTMLTNQLMNLDEVLNK